MSILFDVASREAVSPEKPNGNYDHCHQVWSTRIAIADVRANPDLFMSGNTTQCGGRDDDTGT